MSGFRFGCGQQITISVPRGYSFAEVEVRCGSTARDGGVNQCSKCAESIDAGPLPDEDEGDLEFDHRAFAGGE